MATCIRYGSSATNSVTQSDSHFSKFMKDMYAQDKVAKAGIAVFTAATDIAEHVGAPDATVSGLANTTSVLKDARMTFGLLNIFRGIIPNAIAQVRTMGRLVTGLRTGEGVPLKVHESKNLNRVDHVTIGDETHQLSGGSIQYTVQLKHNERAETTREKVLALIINFFKFIGSLSFIAAFGLARPCVFTEKRIGTLGATAHAMGQTFAPIMLVNHLSGTISSGAELIFEETACTRAYSVVGANRMAIFADYSRKMISTLLNLIYKILEVTHSVLALAKAAVPIWVRIPLSFSIAGFGLYKVWYDTK